MITPTARLASLETRVQEHEDMCREGRSVLYKLIAGMLALSLSLSGFMIERIVALSAHVADDAARIEDAATLTREQTGQLRSDVLELRVDVKRLLERRVENVPANPRLSATP